MRANEAVRGITAVIAFVLISTRVSVERLRVLALMVLNCTPSPQRIASLVVSILLPLGATAVHAAIPLSERTVVLNLYASTSGANWTTSTNWNGAAGTECTWFGVYCESSETSITNILLRANNLTGSLPALAGMTNLQGFDVGSNNITGTIPALTGLASLATSLSTTISLPARSPCPPASRTCGASKSVSTSSPGAFPCSPA